MAALLRKTLAWLMLAAARTYGQIAHQDGVDEFVSDDEDLLRIGEHSVNSSAMSFRAKLRPPQDGATQSRNLQFKPVAGFSTPQERPRADSPAALEMTGSLVTL